MSWNSIFMDGVWWIGMDWSGMWKGKIVGTLLTKVQF